MKKLIFALTLMGLLGGHAPLTASQPVPDAAGYIVKVGDTAPDFEMKLTDGRKVKLSELKGKVVMLQFTASWCGVCRKEMPLLKKTSGRNIRTMLPLRFMELTVTSRWNSESLCQADRSDLSVRT